MKPGSHILQRLQRSRFITRGAVASTGIGDRKSRDVGSGMDFADYRDYVPGDETRHLDARLFARHGRFYIRQFEVERQLPVTLLIDGSGSMVAPSDDKLALARWLAAVFGYIGLAGGDQVQLALWTGRRLEVSRPMSGAKKYHSLNEWLVRHAGEGLEPFQNAFAGLVDQLPQQGLLIVVSDFWLSEVSESITALVARRSEIWAIQVLTPQELDATLLPPGELTLLDVETGRAIDLAINPAIASEYQALLNSHQAGLADAVARVGGRYHLVRTDGDAEHFILHELRAAGMLNRS